MVHPWVQERRIDVGSKVRLKKYHLWDGGLFPVKAIRMGKPNVFTVAERIRSAFSSSYNIKLVELPQYNERWTEHSYNENMYELIE